MTISALHAERKREGRALLECKLNRAECFRLPTRQWHVKRIRGYGCAFRVWERPRWQKGVAGARPTVARHLVGPYRNMTVVFVHVVTCIWNINNVYTAVMNFAAQPIRSVFWVPGMKLCSSENWFLSTQTSSDRPVSWLRPKTVLVWFESKVKVAHSCMFGVLVIT